MTNKDYIMANLAPLGIKEEQIAVVFGNIEPDAEYIAGSQEVGVALTKAIELACFMPKVKSVSESGFSVSYDYTDLAKYYLVLCRMYGVTPNEELSAMAGINRIVDKSSKW